MFKVGDKVVCIDNLQYEDELEFGKFYIVQAISGKENYTILYLKGKSVGFLFYRFAKVNNKTKTSQKPTYSIDPSLPFRSVHEARRAGLKVKVMHYRKDMTGLSEDGYYPDNRILTADNYHFNIGQKGGKTEVEITNKNGQTFKGTSVCSDKENFCRRIGAAIAFERAMKEMVKEENKFTEAFSKEYVNIVEKAASDCIVISREHAAILLAVMGTTSGQNLIEKKNLACVLDSQFYPKEVIDILQSTEINHDSAMNIFIALTRQFKK